MGATRHVVVGAGVMGLASAWALARSGRAVRVLEQFEVGHPHGSSHSLARIFRLAYDDPQWVALAQEALPLWRELEKESGATLLSLTGLLNASSDSGPLRAALDGRGAVYEVLDAAEASRRFGIAVDGDVVLELHGGTVRADRALAAFRARVRVDQGVRVLGLRETGAGVRLETSSGPIDADVAVIAAGAWVTPLLAGAGIELRTRVTRETVTYFRLPGAHTLPSVIDWSFEAEGRGRGEAASIGPRRSRAANGGNERVGRHAYSLASGEDVLKVGLHHSGASVDPGEPGEPDPHIVEAAAEWVCTRFPAADPSPVSAEACLYTNIEDDRFVIERHGSVVVCSACSGHGFKFAPAVGTRVAALA